LSIGPDDRRLVNDGDFNIDINMDDLKVGVTGVGIYDVEITATDRDGNETTETVQLTYDMNNTWPLPYEITDWSTVSNIQNAVHVVDGLWGITPTGLRILEMGYDRVIAIGDLAWTDYEITVPITVNGFDSGPLPPYSVSAGFGITMRWTGHTDTPVYCSQPHCGWLPSGAGAWYDIGSDGPLKLDGLIDPTVNIAVGSTYIWKMRVETIDGVGPLYSLRVWEQGQPQPDWWNKQRQRSLSDVPSGSLIFVFHHVDATIGNLTVTPIADLTPPTVTNLRTTAVDAVAVVFSEPVETVSAQNTGHYAIDNGISVLSATLQTDQKTVLLATTDHAEGIDYSIQIADVADLSGSTMDPVERSYTYSPVQPMVQMLFEEGAGPTAIDSSGFGNDGTLVNGTQWLNDPERGRVIDLDGSNDHVTVDAAALAMNTWTQFTAAAWVKNDVGGGAGTDDIISWWDYPDSKSWVLTHHGNDQYFLEINGNFFITGGTVSTDWTYVAATYDGGMMHLYVNGTEVASGSYFGEVPFSSAPNVIVGGQADGSNYFDGAIDNVEIFDVALTQQEIASRYTISSQCPADLNKSGVVDKKDTELLALAFGKTDCAAGSGCPGDMNDDNVVDGADIAEYIAALELSECQ